MNTKALYQIEYGLFVLTAQLGDKDNGCIVNTVAQVASSPTRISVAVSKQNLTHDMILESGCFNVSVIDQRASFDLFERFGFQSGRCADKLAGLDGVQRSVNGVVYLTQNVNAYLSAKVVSTVDLGSHTLFIAEVTDGDVLSETASMTYSYYHSNVKPQPQESSDGGWRCKICGYVYEGDTLPADFVCPLCKHGAEDFEKI